MKKYLDVLDRTMKLAVDNYPSRYLMHPLDVMSRVQGIRDKIVALAHDLLEDSDVTVSDLEKIGFDEEMIMAMLALTKMDGVKYEDYIAKIKKFPMAIRVKMADLESNLHPGRNYCDKPKLGDYEMRRATKYFRAWHELSCHLDTQKPPQDA